jgi:hypothetical protein
LADHRQPARGRASRSLPVSALAEPDRGPDAASASAAFSLARLGLQIGAHAAVRTTADR